MGSQIWGEVAAINPCHEARFFWLGPLQLALCAANLMTSLFRLQAFRIKVKDGWTCLHHVSKSASRLLDMEGFEQGVML